MTSVSFAGLPELSFIRDSRHCLWFRVEAGAEGGWEGARAKPGSRVGCLDGAGEDTALRIRLSRRVDACARLPRASGSHGGDDDGR